MSHFLWVSTSYWWNIVDKLWTYFMCIHLMRVSHKYDSYNHQIDRIVTGSDVINLMTSHDVGITAVSARIFRVPFAQFLFVRVTKRMWWNFMWLYLIPSPSNDLMWPQWRHVMAIEVECLSRSKNRSVTGSLTVTQTPSIRNKLHLSSPSIKGHQKSNQILWLDEILTNESLARVKPYSQVLK